MSVPETLPPLSDPSASRDQLGLGPVATVQTLDGLTIASQNMSVDRSIVPTTCSSIADLRNLDTRKYSNGSQVSVAGYYTANDGGGGTYVWNSTSTTADNGGTVIQATGVATGRWILWYSGPVNVRWFGAYGDGVHDDTSAIQSSILAATSAGNILVSDSSTYMVTGLTTPSNLTWVGSNTVVKLIAASNVPVLRNANEQFSGYTDHDIAIRGVIFDGNGNNQSDTGAGGVLVTGLRFTGVSGLRLQTTVRQSRRYAYWLINVQNVSGDVVADHTGTSSANRDGFHVNGNCSNISLGTITVINGNDDALALNADDVASGGTFTQANISGLINNVSVRMVSLTNCTNGVRLLSATHEVSDVQIGQIVGQVNYYGFTTGDFSLGTASSYRNIKVGTVSLTYGDSTDAGRSSTAMVMVQVTHPSALINSDFWFGTIARDSGGSDATSLNRDTLQVKALQTIVKVDDIQERFCQNPKTAHISGEPIGADATGLEFYVKRIHKSVSALSGGNYGAAVYVENAHSASRIEVGYISYDNIRFGTVLVNATLNTLDTWRVDGVQAGGNAIDIEGSSTVANFVVRGTPSTLLANAPYYIDGTSSVNIAGATNDRGPWVAVSAFLNSWVNLGAPYPSASYRVNPSGEIELRGLIQSGIVGSAAFQLPAGYRPAFYRLFSVSSNDTFGQVLVDTSGNVIPKPPSSNAWVSLDGIKFRAEQ